MDFEKVIRLIIENFDKGKIRYALIGGFALGVLGIPRATVDIDFIVLKDDMLKVDNIMKSLGYECIFKSENVSQYVSQINIFGEVDFLHAFRKTAVEMLKRSIEKDIFGGSLKIKIVRPEDIIGLKLQSIANDDKRANKEYADIESLLSQYKKDLDWSVLEEYFTIFNNKSKFIELKEKYYNAE